MRKIIRNLDQIPYAICVVLLFLGSFIVLISGIGMISMIITAYMTQEDPYESCTRMSEDLYLCDGEFCNPSTGVCNHVLPLE